MKLNNICIQWCNEELLTNIQGREEKFKKNFGQLARELEQLYKYRPLNNKILFK